MLVTLVIIGIIVASVLLWEIVSSVIERYLSDQDVPGRPQRTSARTRTLLNVARNALLIAITLLKGATIGRKIHYGYD